MAKKVEIPKDRNIIEVPIEEAMPENYLPYAVEVAKDRALPDVRDGLKPVHRRILYGAYLLKAFPDKPYFKSARIVGDILGKFHPHGDTSVYDAMVILAQDFSTRMPLIDGQGNWGSMDGDSAAAMRYTEARLTPIALSLLLDIEKGVTKMVPNYSDKEMEPDVLPARYPNLLVNGSFGIAVGLATNIPPHNLGEVIDGVLAYIDDNGIGIKELMKFIKGPDLPSGGEIIGRESLVLAYETGIGKVALRAKTDIDTLENGKLSIIITEFPYRKNKAKILQMISDMTADKRHAKTLEFISDIRDESDRNGIRAVIEFKKSADLLKVDKVLKYLFKKTELQINLPFNMVAIADGKPETLSLKKIITHYVNHQKDVVTIRTQKELEDAKNRFHIVEGFIKAIKIMDDVIKTIRNSTSRQNAKENLMDKFSFTQIQSNAILELMLYRLTGLEITAFEKEHKALEKQIKDLEKILSSEKELLKVIKKELMEIKKQYNDDRRTIITYDEEEAKIDLEELIIDEDIVVTLSKEGYIKYVTKKTYNRLSSEVSDIEYREGDFNKCVLESNTKDTLIIFTNIGNMYKIKGNLLKEMKWKEKGERLDEIIKSIDFSKESIVSAFSIKNFNIQKVIQIATDDGLLKKTSLGKFDSSYTKLMAIKLKDNQKVIDVRLFDNNREEKVIEVITDANIKFNILEISLLESERSILGKSYVQLPTNVKIKEINYIDAFIFKEFTISLLPSNQIKIGSSQKAIKTISTNSLCDILMLTEKGDVLKLSSSIIQNIENTINLNGLYKDLDEGIVSIVSHNFKEDIEHKENLLFFTREGYIKKTSINEFKGEKTLGHKLKSSSDKLISFDKVSDSDNFIIVTEKGFLLKSSTIDVNAMGKNASGVKGISLKDDDKVIGGKKLSENSEINVITKNKEKLHIRADQIQNQSRATRGKHLFDLTLGDYIVRMK